MLRFPRDGHPKPVMDEGHKPLILSCKLEATETALKHILAYNNGNYRRDGETLSTTLSAKKQLDQLFMGGGKVVQIERKERAKA